MVQEQDVNVAQVQLAQALLNGPRRVAVLVGIELGLHHDLLSRHAGGADTLAHLPLVAIEGGSVNEPVAALQGRPHRIHAGIPVEGVGAQAHHRQIIAAGGLCGLTNEWIMRGMRETPKDMQLLFIAQGNQAAEES